VLLLKRNSLHHHDKWGLPGGNIEESGARFLSSTHSH
jgi:ADP-ribose pyrophosphatase YjhB (NUDIX family)